MTARRWELEAKEVADKAARTKVEKDVVRHETVMAWLEAEAAVSAQAQVELELTRVQNILIASEDGRLKAESELDFVRQVLAAIKEACRKAEEENGHLADEQLSLLMELGAIKEDFVTFLEKSLAEKLALEAEFNASSDVIFNYGYGCYAFTHNICGSKPMIPAEMPDTSAPLTPEFFVNPRCPPGSSSVLSTTKPVEATGEEFCVKGLPATEGGVDISLGSPVRPDKATEG